MKNFCLVRMVKMLCLLVKPSVFRILRSAGKERGLPSLMSVQVGSWGESYTIIALFVRKAATVLYARLVRLAMFYGQEFALHATYVMLPYGRFPGIVYQEYRAWKNGTNRIYSEKDYITARQPGRNANTTSMIMKTKMTIQHKKQNHILQHRQPQTIMNLWVLAFRAAREREETEKRNKDEVEDEAKRVVSKWVSKSEDFVSMLVSIHRVLPSNYGPVMVAKLRHENRIRRVY